MEKKEVKIQLLKLHDKQKQIKDACIDPSIFFVLAVIGRQFGKTKLAENMALYWAINFPNSLIMWVSPTEAQLKKVYTTTKKAIQNIPVFKSAKEQNGQTQITFKNGSKIIYRSASAEDSLRGNSVDYLIVDEAAFIKQATIEQVLLPTLNVKGKKCLFLTTPKGKNWIYDYSAKAANNPKWKFFRFSTFDSPLANEELIQMFRETMSEAMFKQEILGEFVDSAGVFNNLDKILILPKNHQKKDGSRYWAGVDIGLIEDATVISIIDENGNLVDYIRLDKFDTQAIMDKIIELNNIYKFEKIAIENNNQGLPIIQMLEYKLSNIISFNTNTKTKSEIINKLIYLFNKQEMLMIDDDYLRIEFEGFIFKNNNGNFKFFADSGLHDDCVMATAIARWCFENYNTVSDNFQFYY